MTIRVTKITGKQLLDMACAYTVGQPVDVKNLRKMYLSEHSPIRTQIYVIQMDGIPSFVSTHLVRHNVGVSHFVKSNRIDRGGDADVNRLTPVNHMMLINAQALINMARKRLCGKASDETQAVMFAIRDQMVKVDPDLASCMMAECEYRRGCYEFQTCGRWGR